MRCFAWKEIRRFPLSTHRVKCLSDSKALAKLGFQVGMGFVPFSGAGSIQYLKW